MNPTEALAFLVARREKAEKEKKGLLELYNMQFGGGKPVTKDDTGFQEYLGLVAAAAPAASASPAEANGGTRGREGEESARYGAGGVVAEAAAAPGGAASLGANPTATKADESPEGFATRFLAAAGLSEVWDKEGAVLPDAKAAVDLWTKCGKILKAKAEEQDRREMQQRKRGKKIKGGPSSGSSGKEGGAVERWVPKKTKISERVPLTALSALMQYAGKFKLGEVAFHVLRKPTNSQTGAKPSSDHWRVRAIVGSSDELGEGAGSSRTEALELASLHTLHLFDPTGKALAAKIFHPDPHELNCLAWDIEHAHQPGLINPLRYPPSHPAPQAAPASYHPAVHEAAAAETGYYDDAGRYVRGVPPPARSSAAAAPAAPAHGAWPPQSPAIPPAAAAMAPTSSVYDYGHGAGDTAAALLHPPPHHDHGHLPVQQQLTQAPPPSYSTWNGYQQQHPPPQADQQSYSSYQQYGAPGTEASRQGASGTQQLQPYAQQPPPQQQQQPKWSWHSSH